MPKAFDGEGYSAPWGSGREAAEGGNPPRLVSLGTPPMEGNYSSTSTNRGVSMPGRMIWSNHCAAGRTHTLSSDNS